MIYHDFPDVIRIKKSRINVYKFNDTQSFEGCLIYMNFKHMKPVSCVARIRICKRLLQNHLRVSEKGKSQNKIASSFMSDVTLRRLLHYEFIGLRHHSMCMLLHLINL